MTTGTGLTLTVRNDDMREVGPLTGWLGFDADLRCMGAGGTTGQGTVVVPLGHPALATLIDTSGPIPQAAGGIVARRAGEVLTSGRAVLVDIDDSADGSATISWVPDDAITAKETAYVDPAVDIPTGTTATSATIADVRTGSAGAVIAAYVAANIGPAAGVVGRRYPWLTIPSPGTLAGVGTSGTWSARDEPLLDLLRRIAAGNGVVWQLTQATNSTVALTVRAPSATPAARFSAASGTVTGLRLTMSRRTVDTVLVGGGGDGAARVRTRKSLTVPAGQVRSVDWILQGSSTAYADLQQAAAEALTEGAATAAAEFTLVEPAIEPGSGLTPRLFGVDWRLGDVVSVASRSGVVVEQPVVAVRITQTATDPAPVITPQIGSLDSVGSITGTADVRRLLSPLLRS